jgi:mannosyltransferase OCH1-like enzyme
MNSVPKKIMQTWKTHTPPEKWVKTVEETKRLMPDYEYTLLSDDDITEFITKYYPQYLSILDRMKYPIMKADFIRYLWLHKYGGFYYDLDMCPSRSLNELYDIEFPITDGFREKIFLVPSGNCNNIYTNSFIASAPDQPFWIDLVEDIIDSVEGNSKKLPWFATKEKHLYVLYVTGPNAVTRLANERKFYVLPKNIINAYKTCDLYDSRNGTHWKPESIFYALEGSSWVDPTVSFLNKIRCRFAPDISDFNLTFSTFISLLIILVVVLIIIIILNKYKFNYISKPKPFQIY